MLHLSNAFCLAFAAVSGAALGPHAATATRAEPRREATIEQYFGVAVPDPYQWMEELDIKELATWVTSQDAATHAWLDQGHRVEAVRAKIRRVARAPQLGAPSYQGNTLTFSFNRGGEAQATLYTGEPEAPISWRPLMSAEALGLSSTQKLIHYVLSPRGTWAAYSTSESGADWQTLHVRRTGAARDEPEAISGVKLTEIAWLPDESGFFYTRQVGPKSGDMTALNGQGVINLHRLHTHVADDAKIFAHPDPRFDADPLVAEDGSLLLAVVARGSERRHGIYAKSLASAGSPWVQVVAEGRGRYEILGAEHGLIVAKTFEGAPRGRLVQLDASVRGAEPKEIIAEHPQDVMHSVAWTAHGFVVSYLHDATSRLRRFDFAGRLMAELPTLETGYVHSLHGHPHQSSAYFAMMSNHLPSSVYRLDMMGDQTRMKRIFTPTVEASLHTLTTYRTMATNNQGHRLPVIVSHRKNLACLKTGGCPTRLYGYGGFTLPVYPAFGAGDVVWMDHGGVVARAITRGGGEYGDAWHDAATRTHKQNTFDDFFAVMQHLEARGISHPRKLGIEGSSNGGLLVGATLTQHPEAVGAAYAHAAVLDMVRFARFTAGRHWLAEYGDVAKPEEFAALWAYSPVHHVQPAVVYPPTMVVTGDHDDRVVPSHSYKFVAALQHARPIEAPYFLKIEPDAGHEAGPNFEQGVAQEADKLIFFARTLGLDM